MFVFGFLSIKPNSLIVTAQRLSLRIDRHLLTTCSSKTRLMFQVSMMVQARSEDEAWGVAETLWRLTNSGALTLDLLRDTRIVSS